MHAFTIKDLENLSGIKAHTIRIWEQRYSFLKPQRTGTNIRYYTNEELRKLLNIALLNKYGYKISHINRMTTEQVHERIILLTQFEAVLEKTVNDLVMYMVDVNLKAFEELLDNYIATKGIEWATAQVIFPLLEKAGILWLTGHIVPAQEHLASNIIRQKIIVGTENTVNHLKQDKTALLFLPEDDYHELGLLYMQYMLKSRGFTVLYLGASTALADLGYIAKLKKPDFIYTHIISAPHNFNLDRFLVDFIALIRGIPLVITGKYAKIHKKNLPPSIHFKQSLAEVMEYAGSL